MGADAAVNVYVAAPLCAEAREELARDRGRAGDVRVRAICLPGAERGGRLDLAQIGANARRAVEDSTTVAYIGEAAPRAARFSRPILEAADVAQLSGQRGGAAMARLLPVIERADASGSLRQSVYGELR